VIVSKKTLMLLQDGKVTWLMTFHPDKCSVLTITNKKNPVKHNYLLHNHTLESVSSAKYLGITLQSDLAYLAARRWTISIVLQCSAVSGFQTEHAYSSFGRTRDRYACDFITTDLLPVNHYGITSGVQPRTNFRFSKYGL
jgi:hypothetical protein